MQIVIDVSSYYDWEPYTGTPTKEDVLALKYKPAQDGKWLKKVLKTKPSQTEIGLPEAEIINLMEHFERVGLPKARERVVAHIIEEKVMPHHAHQDHWVKISVHEDISVEMFLNKYFNLD